MPKISCLFRKWAFASDDLFYAGILELMGNTAWLVAMLVVFVLDSPADAASCPLSMKLKIYFVIMIAALSVTEFLLVVVTYVSSRGTIMNEDPRRSVGRLLIARGVVRLCDFCASVYAATFVFTPLLNDAYAICEAVSPAEFAMGRVSVVVSVVLFICSVAALAVLYDPLGRARIKSDAQKFEERAQRMYRKRMNCCLYFCARGKPRDAIDRNRLEAFSLVAEYFAEFFESDDLAATDVLAGLILLGKEHRTDNLSTIRHTHAAPVSDPETTESASDLRALLDAHGVANWPAQLDGADDNKVERIRVTFDLHLQEDGKPYVLPDSKAANVQSQLDWLDVRVLRRVLKFATGIYGWPIYAIKHRPTDVLCSLLPKLRCCAPCCCCRHPAEGGAGGVGKANPDLESGLAANAPVIDNCCEGNLAAFLLETGVRRADVLYASWIEAGMHRVAFGVVLDHALRSVVIVVRGTLSVGDVLTDIGFDLAHLTAPSASYDDFLDAPNHHPLFQPSSVPPDEVDAGAEHNNAYQRASNADSPKAHDYDETDAQGRRVYLVHSGILHAAMRVRRCIDERRLLETAFQKYPTYKLVISGHSLGAGVTALLGWSYAATAHRLAASDGGAEKQLALHAAMRKLVCYAFAPPCGLVSRSASLHLRRFVCSVYLGDDLVPRLSVATMNMLKNELLVVLRDCPHPKYRVLANGCWQLCCGAAAAGVEAESEVDLTYEATLTPNNRQLLTPRRGRLLERAKTLDAERQRLKVTHFPRMYVPGLVVQISAEYTNATNNLEYRLDVTNCDQLQRIVVSSAMVAHHLPTPLLSALGHLSRLVDRADKAGVLHACPDPNSTDM